MGLLSLYELKSPNFQLLILQQQQKRKENHASKLSHYRPNKDHKILFLFAILEVTVLSNLLFEEEKLS